MLAFRQEYDTSNVATLLVPVPSRLTACWALCEKAPDGSKTTPSTDRKGLAVCQELSVFGQVGGWQLGRGMVYGLVGGTVVLSALAFVALNSLASHEV